MLLIINPWREIAMKACIVVLLAGLLLASAGARTLPASGLPPPVQDVAQGSGNAELVQLNRALFESMIVHRDPQLFAATAFDEVVVIPPGGIVESKAQAIAGLGAFDASAVALEDVQVVLRGDTALVVGRLTITGEVRGMVPAGPMRFLNVFVMDDGAWRLLARSLTPCAERAIAAGRC